MRCPYCGAETQSAKCEYCGSEMPQPQVQQQQPNINVTNNYYGSAPQNNANTNPNVNVGTCPKCGSPKIDFKRERIGTTSHSTSRKKAIGSGRKGQSVSHSSYRTIGLCKNCGFTWNPNVENSSVNSKSGAPIWLWILGWICIFPLPLTILMLRRKNMKPALKYGIIAAAWIIFLLIGICCGGSDSSSNSTNGSISTSQVTTEENALTTTTVTEEETDKSVDLSSIIEEKVNEYNSQGNEKLEYVEDFVPSDENSSHYRTEFRLNAWKDAVGKSYKLGDSIVDIVVTDYYYDLNFRVYSSCNLEQAEILVDGFAPLLDEELTVTELNDTVAKIEEGEDINGYSFGELDLLILDNFDGTYDFMLKYE